MRTLVALLLLTTTLTLPPRAAAHPTAGDSLVHNHGMAHADESVPPLGPGDYCGPSIPADEALGFVPLPEGDVFCPLIADPKGTFSFVAYVRGTSDSPLGTDMGSIGVADRFPLMRWGGPKPGEGIQLGLDGGVFAQFDLDGESLDLINADYVVGLPLTLRFGHFSTRLRVYHQSSHLGDEFILREEIDRENLSFEAVEGILSLDIANLRLYGGGEYVFEARPEEGVITQVAHGGIELRQKKSALSVGTLASVRLIAALDVKAVEVTGWEPSYSVRAGFEVGRARPTQHVARRWSVLGHFYDGRSPYGQFFREDVRYYGIGIHFEQ
jgi:hypothetical protein